MTKRNHGHERTFPGHKTAYRLISVMENGVRRQRFEHRLVMEKVLGRPLLKTEVVHHIDGNGLNNDPTNLELMTQAEHVREHLLVGPKTWDFPLALKMREQGSTFQEIGDHFGVNQGSIRNLFASRGLSTKDLRHGTTKWDFDLAVKLYLDENRRMAEIARVVGVSAPSVRKAFLRNGIPLRT